jgi:hypothetical protein
LPAAGRPGYDVPSFDLPARRKESNRCGPLTPSSS